jgi:hypothetical protein
VPTAQATPLQIRIELGKGYDNAHQLSLLDELTAMLETQTKTEAALKEFRAKLAEFLKSEAGGARINGKQPDMSEGAITGLSDAKWRGRSVQEALGRRQGRPARRHLLADERACRRRRAIRAGRARADARRALSPS